jgi:uncharacterized protein YjbI with pentapeptide repeats
VPALHSSRELREATGKEKTSMRRLARARARAAVCGTLGVVVLLAFAAPLARAACTDSPRAGVDWSKCQKGRLIMRGAELSSGSFKGTDFGRSDLSGAKLVGADLERAALDNARLVGADLSRAKLVKVNGYRANLSEARLVGADLTKAELQRANLSKADLTGANLGKAELARTDLKGAQLANARLERADLARAEFSGANLSGANVKHAHFFLTRIEGVDLSMTLGLVQRQLDDACGDAGTKLPAGLKAPASWPCPKDE